MTDIGPNRSQNKTCEDESIYHVDAPDFRNTSDTDVFMLEVHNVTELGCVNCTKEENITITQKAPTILPRWASKISVNLVPYKIPAVVERMYEPVVFTENYTIGTKEGQYEVVIEKNETRVEIINSTDIEAYCQISHNHKCIVWVAPPAINDTEFSYLKKFDIFSKIQKKIKTTSDDECKISVGVTLLEGYEVASYQKEI